MHTATAEEALQRITDREHEVDCVLWIWDALKEWPFTDAEERIFQYDLLFDAIRKTHEQLVTAVSEMTDGFDLVPRKPGAVRVAQ